MPPSIIVRRKARRRADVDALGDGGQAWVHIALSEAIDVLLRGLVCMLNVRRQMLERPIPPGITAPVHVDVALSDDEEAGEGSYRSQLGGALSRLRIEFIYLRSKRVLSWLNRCSAMMLWNGRRAAKRLGARRVPWFTSRPHILALRRERSFQL
jgi:hypothetical protein